MIAKVLVFMVDVADESQLTLDPVMDTYYFMDTVVTKMPAMLEPLGITRARGTGVLTKQGTVTLQNRAGYHCPDRPDDRYPAGAQNKNMDKVMRYAPALQDSLSGPTKRIFGRRRENLRPGPG